MRRKYTLIFIICLLTVTLSNADPPEWEPITGTEFSMLLIAQISWGNEMFGPEQGNMAAAFGPGGTEDCRAIATWQEANPPYFDGFWHFVIVGNTNGEPINFKIYHATFDSVYACTNTISFENNATIGSPYEPYELTVGNMSIEPSESENLRRCTLYQNVPNPFSAQTSISFYLPTPDYITLQIFNIRGQLIETIEKDYKESGIHTAYWNAKEMVSNVYIYKLTTSTSIQTKKCIHLQQ